MRHFVPMLLVLAVTAAAFCPALASAQETSMDLAGAAIVVRGENAVLANAARMLQEEIAKRTGISLPLAGNPAPGKVAIVLGTVESIPEAQGVPEEPEGYLVRTDGQTVSLVGRDDRGALFAAGRLLRLLEMTPGRLGLARDISIATAPRYRIRGHEIGYRNKSNTYDAWDMKRYEQYIRDLAVFGNNMIQLIFEPKRDLIEGAHLTETQTERCAKLAALCESYGIDLWIWMPIDEPLDDPEEAAKALQARRAFFEAVSPLTAVFVPRGSQKSTNLLDWMPSLADVLHESQPEAQLWLSSENESNVPNAEWNDTLFDYLRQQQPAWLNGAVFDTWQEFTLQAQRERVPEQYPISLYTDITHSIECQYPVPHWDRAFAMTLGREGINPRPMAMAHISHLLSPLSEGFNTYSDGVNDDVNKIIWDALGWDPDIPVEQVLEEYGDYFIGEGYGEDIAKGLLALEQNWVGPVAGNPSIAETLALWQAIEKRADASVLANWRFQMGLYRAYYDAYIQQKLAYETDLETQACAELARARETGVVPAIQSARTILAKAEPATVAPDLRRRIEELGGALFDSIGMQLSVKRFGALSWERGATLDTLDRPLNNRLWLEAEMCRVLIGEDEEDRCTLLDAVLNWEDPGPGGFYDDLGCATKQPHLVHQHTWEQDPGFVESAQDEHITTATGCPGFPEMDVRRLWRLSWLDQATTLYYTPLCMRYTGLDPDATYTLRVVYTGRFRPKMRLVANGKFEIHGPTAQPSPPTPLEFEIPAEATRGGVLELEWSRLSGRGPQVAEAWLIRNPE